MTFILLCLRIQIKYISVQVASKGNSVSCSNTPQIKPRNNKGIALHNNHRFGRSIGGQKQAHYDSNNILLSPTRSEEHQYDIPFSHLSPGVIRPRKNTTGEIDPEYDEMIINDTNQHSGNRGSTAVLLPQSSLKPNKVPWNKFSSDGSKLRRRENNPSVTEANSSGMLWGGNTLLQPRLISGETGGTPLLSKHRDLEGTHRWSGSDRSIDTSIYSGN